MTTTQLSRVYALPHSFDKWMNIYTYFFLSNPHTNLTQTPTFTLFPRLSAKCIETNTKLGQAVGMHYVLAVYPA